MYLTRVSQIRNLDKSKLKEIFILFYTTGYTGIEYNIRNIQYLYDKLINSTENLLEVGKMTLEIINDFEFTINKKRSF